MRLREFVPQSSARRVGSDLVIGNALRWYHGLQHCSGSFQLQSTPNPRVSLRWGLCQHVVVSEQPIFHRLRGSHALLAPLPPGYRMWLMFSLLFSKTESRTMPPTTTIITDNGNRTECKGHFPITGTKATTDGANRLTRKKPAVS